MWFFFFFGYRFYHFCVYVGFNCRLRAVAAQILGYLSNDLRPKIEYIFFYLSYNIAQKKKKKVRRLTLKGKKEEDIFYYPIKCFV